MENINYFIEGENKNIIVDEPLFVNKLKGNQIWVNREIQKDNKSFFFFICCHSHYISDLN